MSRNVLIYAGGLVVAAAVGYVTVSFSSTGAVDRSATRRTATADNAAATVREPGMPPLRTMNSLSVGKVRSLTVTQVESLAVQGVSLHDVFAQEPRNSEWATAIEKLALQRVQAMVRDLMPYATNVALECHATTCQYTLNVPQKSFAESFHFVQRLPLSEFQSPLREDVPDHADQVKITLTMMYSAEAGGQSDIEKLYETQFAQRFPSGFAGRRKYADENPFEDFLAAHEEE